MQTTLDRLMRYPGLTSKVREGKSLMKVLSEILIRPIRV